MDVFTYEQKQIGKPWKYAAAGPAKFDCVGLQKAAFKQAGRGDLVDNSYTVAHLADMYRHTGRASSTIKSARPGDFIVYGRYEHVALLLPSGKIISAITSGVRITGRDAMRYSSGKAMPATLVLHTGYLSTPPAPTPPAPTPPPVVAPTVRLHKVLSGETLWGIAAAMLGAGSRYSEIQALNVGLIPADPHELRAGVVLKIPLE
jgi:nucleoid-associated protein YgaU